MNLIESLLIEPLSYEFMQRGLIVAILVGSCCAVFSCFLILKGWSLMGDAVSHAVLPGLVLAHALGLPLMLGAFVSGLSCSLGIGYLKRNCRVQEDALMGIVFSGMFAFGLVLLTKVESELHLLHILFGNILGSSWQDVAQITGIVSLVFGIIFLKYKDLVLYCFDPIQAQVSALPVKLLHYGLFTLLSLTIVAALKAAGIILVIAMLIAPGAIAFLLTSHFNKMVLISVSISVLSCMVGVILSFHLDIATTPLIVVFQAIIFCIVLITQKVKA